MTGRGPATGAKVALGSVAMVLAVASAAFACTHYRGTLKVTGDAAGSGTVEAVAHDGGGMNHCSDPRLTGPANVEGTAGPAPGLGRITIRVESGTCNGVTTQLSDGRYTVTWTEKYARDCMAQPGGVPQGFLGSIDVVSGQAGPATFTVPATGVTDTAGVCITSVNPIAVLEGNKAPFTINPVVI